jgi:hypothetical protein
MPNYRDGPMRMKVGCTRGKVQAPFELIVRTLFAFQLHDSDPTIQNEYVKSRPLDSRGLPRDNQTQADIASARLELTNATQAG